MRLELTVRGERGDECDVAITAEPSTPVGEIVARLASRFPAAGHGLWANSRRLPPGAGLGALGLNRGALVTTGRAGEPDLVAGAAIRLHVVGGPSAGQIIALGRGDTTIGRSPDCPVALDDPQVSRRHASITVSASGIRVRDLGSTNGTTVDGLPVPAGGRSLDAGQHLRVGDSTLAISTTREPAAAVHPGTDGAAIVNRAPRRQVTIDPGPVIVPDLPRRDRAGGLPVLAAVLPALAGAGLAVVTGQLLFLVFALASPLVLLADRWHGHRVGRRGSRQLRADRSAALRQIASALADEQTARREAHPDPAGLLLAALTPSCRVWERGRGDPDFLDARLGLADQPSVLLAGPGAGSDPAPAGTVISVPVAVGLRAGPIGICGPAEIRRRVARGLVGQLATLHSPADLDLALLGSAGCGPSWTWLRWLPHLTVASTGAPAERSSLIADWRHELDRRASRPGGPTAAWTGAWTVLIVDLDGDDAEIDGLTALLERGPAVGITAIWLSEARRQLPATCTAVAGITGELGSLLQIERPDADGGPVGCVADQVDPAWAQSLARALAPLHDAARETGRSIPSHCRLLDVNDLRAPTAAAIGDRWQAGGAPIATIGMGEHGPLRIDLARDGPHALIAGTTGAGKSELLRSIVAGLALNNSPLDLSFVLFDYKGGAAFAECARLPHTAAVITDLDDRLAHRALRSLNAELRRRERLLADSGAGELSDYRAGPGQIMNPLGRLVLVVDEFAALADELPELLGGLIAIAARGRSLGIHLILATQRATGAVSAEMQANLALRIALRLIDPAEALALVGTAAPAAIDKARPGRAFVRLGPTAQEFQTAHLATTITADGGEVRVEFLDDWGRAVRTGPPAGSPGSAGAEHSDLRVLVDSMRAVPLPAGADQRSRPWLSPLDDLLSIDQLAAPPGPQLVAIGLIDLPDEQRQEPLVVDLDRGGSILIAGPAGSGRSLALQTLTAAAARRRSCAELQLFVVDCASHGLDPLAALPHCGAALSDDDPEPIARLLHRLTEEVSRRRAEPNPRDLEAGPALLLLIDGWENLVTALDDYDSGASIEILQTLLRDGPSARLTIAVTGGRASLRHRAVAGVGATYLLGAVSPDIAALVGLPAPARPRGAVSPRTTAPPPPGRAIRVPDGSEVQFAFLGADAGAATQQQVVGEIAAGTSAGAARTSGRRIRIRPLPRRVQRDHLDAGRELQPGEVVLGVGGDAGEPIAVDLFAGDGRWLVAGPPGSGRSSLLAGALTQLHAAGIEVQVAAHPRSQLGEVAARLGIEALAPDGLAPDRPATDRRLAVLIDDVELFTDAAIADALRDLAQLHEPGRGDGSTAVLASGRSDDLANAYQGIAATIRRSRTGVLLRPAPADGALLAVQLPRTRAISPVGRGVLVCDQPQIVQLARGRAALPVQIAL